MLALVTCHIFPPSIWYGKKMNSWHLTSRLTARSFSESTASRVRSGRCPRQCTTLLHGQEYLQEKTPVLQFGHTLEQNSWIRPIISYLWMVDLVMRFFFLWGQPLKIIHKNSAKKRSSPLDFIFDTCASASSSHLFFGWWSWRYVVVPFLQGPNAFSAKNICVVICARVDTKILGIRPIMSYLWMIGLVMRLFSCGASLWRSSASIQSKKVQPLEFYFWHVRLGLLKSPFLVGEAEHMWLYPFLQGQMSFQKKKTPVLQFGRVDTKFLNSSHHVLSVDDWPGDATFFLRGQPLKIIPQVFSQKKVQPLGFYFWHLRLGLFKVTFFGWWSWTCVSVPFLQGTTVFSAKKNMCFANWARVDTKFLNSSHHVLSVDDWPGDATFFPVGPTFEDHPQVFSQKRSQPLGFYFWPLRLGLLKSLFFGWWRWTYVFVPFCQSHVKNHTPSSNHGTFFPGVWHLDMF